MYFFVFVLLKEENGTVIKHYYSENLAGNNYLFERKAVFLLIGVAVEIKFICISSSLSFFVLKNCADLEKLKTIYTC